MALSPPLSPLIIKGFPHEISTHNNSQNKERKKKEKHSSFVSPSCSLLLYDWREERERRTRRQRAPAKLRFSTRRVKPAAAVIRLCACYYFICVFFESFSSMCFLEERERERERERGKDEKKGSVARAFVLLKLKTSTFFYVRDR